VKRVLTSVFLLWIFQAAAQFSVEWNFADFTGQPERVRRVVIRPLAFYGVQGSNIISGDRISFLTGSRGGILLSNVSPGAYQVKLFGRNSVTTFTNYFPPNLSGQVNAAGFVVVSTNYGTGPFSLAPDIVDSRYMTNPVPPAAYGYVLTLLDSDGNYAWVPNSAGADAIRNNQQGLTLGGTFNGRLSGDGTGLTNVLGMNISVNQSPVAWTNYSRFRLSGFGDTNANGVYDFAGLLNGNVYFSNGQFLLVSNLAGGGSRWGITNNGLVAYLSPRTNTAGYPSAGTWLVNSGRSPGGTMEFDTTLTNGNGFVSVNSTVPVLVTDGNTEARVETYGSDITGRIGVTPVMPFASLDGVTVFLTNNLGWPTNDGFIRVGPGRFAGATLPILSGQSVIGAGPGITTIDGQFRSIRVQNSNMLQNLSLTYPINNTAYDIGCTNLTLINVDIGTRNPLAVIDGLFSTRGYLDGFYDVTARGCHFASSWDLTQGVVTGTFYDCQMDTFGGPANNGSGLHPYTVQWENCSYVIRGGEASVSDGPAITISNGLPANACVWVVATNANVRLFGPQLNHHGTNGVDYAIYNLYENTNIIGWYFDNGVLTYVDGTNYWTNTPPQGWPPPRLFEKY
jgi:hypothetical protein